jgi:hypothetical protein
MCGKAATGAMRLDLSRDPSRLDPDRGRGGGGGAQCGTFI